MSTVVPLSVLKKRIVFFIAFSLLGSCATPSSQYNNIAKDNSLVSAQIKTATFTHVYYSNTPLNGIKSDQTLHVYLEGDGTPWVNGQWIAADPTPRNAVMLALMRLDSSPAIILGRPCYHLEPQDPECHFDDWTTGRYSSRVISSMVQAIEAIQRQHGVSDVALFGHSGGGAIALLIAQSLQQKKTRITAVVTLAANLDTHAWAVSRGYLPLSLSLNPALLPALPSSIFTLHLFGENDQVVDGTLFKHYLSSRPSEKSIVYTGFDHSCCWATVWLDILEQVKAAQNSPLKPAVNE